MIDTYIGKIIKGIAGFYYVETEKKGLFECKAKGLFRKEKIKPLVGDNVCIQIIDEEKRWGNIEEILPRYNSIVRPACANIDRAIIVMAISKPAIKELLLDKIMVFFEYFDIPITLCINKMDEAKEGDKEVIEERYRKANCDIIWTSSLTLEGLEDLKSLLKNKTSILTGPSGVGKSSLINRIMPEAEMEVGDISKIGRGKHTTRHTEIFKIAEKSFIFDTPGFTSLELPSIPKEKLRFYFPEFLQFEGQCKFKECLHLNEPNCKVKEEVENGNINQSRYESYKEMYNLIKDRKTY